MSMHLEFECLICGELKKTTKSNSILKWLKIEIIHHLNRHGRIGIPYIHCIPVFTMHFFLTHNNFCIQYLDEFHLQ